MQLQSYISNVAFQVIYEARPDAKSTCAFVKARIVKAMGHLREGKKVGGADEEVTMEARDSEPFAAPDPHDCLPP